MGPIRFRGARIGVTAVIFAVAAVALLVNVPVSARAAPAAQPSIVKPAAGLTASVTWNGVDISTVGSTSSALSIDFSQSANLDYVWSNAPAPGINDVRLQMFYFGFAIVTRDVTLSAPQTQSAGVPLNWTPLSIDYVLEGLYKLTASLVAPNGTTMWSENFYVRGTAPLGFVALIPIVLLIIAVYEIYALARSGRYAALGRKPVSPPPEKPPTEAPPSAPSEAPPSEAEAPPGAPSETPPPAGGSS